MISFGPFLTRKEQPRTVEPGLLYVGYVLEFTSQAVAASVPIFRCVREGDSTVNFKDYVVQATDIFVLLDKTYERINKPALGSYVPLKTFLTGLYEEHKPYRSFQEFMVEFRQYLPLSEPYDFPLG